MKLKKAFIKICLVAIVAIGFICVPGIYRADGESVRIDCDGGTFRIFAWANAFDQGYHVPIGQSMAENKCHLEDATDMGRDFTGWNIYAQSDGRLLESMLTTQQVLDYKIPCSVKIVAQYNNRPGAPVTDIIYAAVDNDTGDVVWDAKITLIYDGVSYSGYGYVSISKEVYSKWTKKITYITEAPGWYQRMNNKWVDGTKDVYQGTPSDFRRHKSQYFMFSKTGKGKEIEHPRSKINEMFYQASLTEPNISIAETVNADTMISDTSVIPSGASMEKEIYKSGKTYDAALAAAQSKYNTSNIMVVDLELKDSNGASIHQLSQSTQVRLDIPSDYVIQTGNTVVVYYLEDDGTLTECPTTYHEENGNRYVLFETNHFSPYVMVEVPEKVEEPEEVPTEDTQIEDTTEKPEGTEVEKDTETTESENTNSTEDADNNGSNPDGVLPIIIVVIVALAVVAGILIAKKKKA